MIASFGEIRIHWLGFWLQIAGLVFEAMRLVMIQVLLSSEDDKMDPLVSLYYYAPVCGLMNLVMVWFTEWQAFRMEDFFRVGPNILVFNAMVAFCLNVAGVFLVSPPPMAEDQLNLLTCVQIGKTNSLVMTLTGIFKSILLVVAGVMIWGTTVGSLQMFGYFLALFGLFIYSVPSEKLKEFAGSITARWKA